MCRSSLTRGFEGTLEQRRAIVERARLDVQNATRRSRVTGQVRLQQVEVGGLPTTGQTMPHRFHNAPVMWLSACLEPITCASCAARM